MTGVAAGTSATVRWTVGTGGCTAFDDVTVTNNAPPTVSNQPNQTHCNNSTFTMTQSGTGTWTLVSGTATITTPSSPTTTVTGVAAGTSATVRWTTGTGGCTAFDDVTLTNNAAPTVSNQPNQTHCNNSSFTMTQTGTGTWTLVSGTATITTPSSPTTTVTGVAAGTSATVRWTTGTGGCTAFDDVVLTNNSGPTASIFYLGDPFCTSNNSTINPTRTGQSGGTYWATPAGLNFNTGNGAIKPKFSTPGTYTVTYTFSNETCTNTTSTTVHIVNCSRTEDETINNPKQNAINQAELAITVYPIPSETNFTLKVQSKLNQNVEVNIYDAIGRKIQQLRGSALDTYRFGDMYAAGAYIVEVLQGSNRVTQKILKQ